VSAIGRPAVSVIITALTSAARGLAGAARAEPEAAGPALPGGVSGAVRPRRTRPVRR
jgi:hypothetical protein